MQTRLLLGLMALYFEVKGAPLLTKFVAPPQEHLSTERDL